MLKKLTPFLFLALMGQSLFFVALGLRVAVLYPADMTGWGWASIAANSISLVISGYVIVLLSRGAPAKT